MCSLAWPPRCTRSAGLWPSVTPERPSPPRSGFRSWRSAAARQLLYHRWLSEWISRKTVENEAILEGYLVSSGEERATLLGGYVLERAGEDRESSSVYSLSTRPC